MSFVFFDTETTGLSRAFDQIVHFAAIRTDNDLREVERFEAASRLADHVIAHPQAMSVNGLGIGQLLDRSRPSHYAMVGAIQEKLLAWSPSLFVGFNSIRFDEEMLRQALYQTLRSPYLTSLNGNGRTDALGLALAASAVSPDAIAIPLNNEGKGVFRLPELARANAIPHAPHNPMSDVEATIALCSRVQMRVPEVWQRFIRFSRKATTADFIDYGDPFLLTEFYANEAYHSPVVCIGKDSKQPNLRYCLLLNRQTKGLLAMSDDDLCLAVGCKPSPVRKIRINAAPMMTPLYEVENLPDLDHDEVEALAQEIRADTQSCARIVQHYGSVSSPPPAARCVEESIYAGFLSPEDEKLMIRFHQVPWPDRLSIVMRLRDERARSLGLRLIHLEAPGVLPHDLVQEVRSELANRHHDGEYSALSVPQALNEIDSLLGGQESSSKALLLEYRNYLIQRLA